MAKQLERCNKPKS